MSEEETPEPKSHDLAIQIANTPWDELETFEAHDYVHFPEVLLRRRGGKEGFEAIKVALRIPKPAEKRKARALSRAAALADNLDLEKDADLVDDLENMHLLSMAIRNRTKPYEAMVPDPLELERLYDQRSLAQLWTKLNSITDIVDPRPNDLSREEVLHVIAQIAKTQQIYPLHVLGPQSQISCIATMAALSVTYLASKSSSEPSDSLTPEP